MNEPLDRNLERLLRAAAAPPADAERARREFLRRAEGTAPVGRRIAMAAAALVIAALLYSALSPSRPLPGKGPAAPQDPTAETAPATDNRHGGVPTQDLRPAPRPAVATRSVTVKDDQVSLTATLPSAQEVNPRLQLAGLVPYPDGTRLQVTVQRTTEQLSAGRLVAVPERVGMLQPVVEKGRFTGSAEWRGEGRYQVRIALAEDQRAEFKRMPSRVSTLDLAGWGDDLAARLAPALLTVEDLSKRALEIVDRLEKLAAKESTWIQERKNEDPRGADIVLTREAKAMMKELYDLTVRLDGAEAQGLHPAALQEMKLTIQKLSGSAAYFVYEKGTGKFAGVRNYHAPEKQVETHRGDAFTFEVIKRYLAEAPRVAGRETALWLVQDLRRTASAPAEPFVSALKLVGERPGISLVAARLSKPDPSQFDALEREIREGRS